MCTLFYSRCHACHVAAPAVVMTACASMLKLMMMMTRGHLLGWTKQRDWLAGCSVLTDCLPIVCFFWPHSDCPLRSDSRHIHPSNRFHIRKSRLGERYPRRTIPELHSSSSCSPEDSVFYQMKSREMVKESSLRM